MTTNFPDMRPSNETWRPMFNTQTFSSSFNNATQTSSLPGALWSANLTFSKLTKLEAMKLRGFMAALRGQAGRFYLTPIDAKESESSPGGTPAVNGSSQTGGELITDGWTPNTTVRYAGEYIEVNSELKIVTEDAVSDGSGGCTIAFSPDLHSSPPNNEPIVTTEPKCFMKLVNDDQVQWQLSQNQVYAISLQCIEALDV